MSDRRSVALVLSLSLAALTACAHSAKAPSTPAMASASSVEAPMPTRELEPNTRIPAGAVRYPPSVFPDRIIATPAQDAARGFAVSWRTDASVHAPWLEIAVAGDSPDIGDGQPRRLRAQTRLLATGNGAAHHHQVQIDALQPDTLYLWRVQGAGTFSAWQQMRTAPEAGQPITLLYFGDTQNKNVSHVTRVLRESLRHAPKATLALYAGDLVSEAVDDEEWGEWFEATDAVASIMLSAPAIGNHEYFEDLEDTPQERRVLGEHWKHQFALPGNGAVDATGTTYWFDFGDLRVVVLDGTSALDLDTAATQARWLDQTLSNQPNRWTVVLMHQPLYALRAGRSNPVLIEHFGPVFERHRVDLVLQGHDHLYGRRGPESGADTPQFIASVTGPKQYRMSGDARRTMRPVAEDTQLFQVIRVDGDRLHYEARTATGRLYDAFELHTGADGRRHHTDIEQDRIAPRDCSHRAATLNGRKDRCWE